MQPTHFAFTVTEPDNISGAAEWAWVCIVGLANLFCLRHCDRSKCYADTQSWDRLPEDWEVAQERLHQALAYLPTLHNGHGGCPACSLVEAFLLFPRLIEYSPVSPVTTLKMNAVDCSPEIGFVGNVQEASFPCCIIDTLVGDFEHSIENRCREMALLNLDEKDFPVMPPWERSQLVQPFLKGQAVARMIWELREGTGQDDEYQERDEAEELAGQNEKPSPMSRLNLSTAVTAVVCLRDLLRIRCLFPKAIQDDDARRLRTGLVNQLESVLKNEPLLRKIERELYRRPMDDEFAAIDQLSFLYPLMLVHHPDFAPSGEDPDATKAAMQNLLKKCISEAHKPVREAADQIVHYKVNNCLYPDPADDASFREPGRFLQMVTMYWGLVAQAIIDRTGHFCGFSPYPLAGLFENVRLRIETCGAGLVPLGLAEWDARMEEMLSLLDALTSWEGDELSVGGEDLSQRVQDVNTWLERTRLKKGCKRYEVTQEEESFLAWVREEVRQYDLKVQEEYQRLLRSASKSPREPASEPTEQRSEATGKGKVTIGIDRRDDGVHWLVNGEDKGVFYTKEGAIKAKILNILYEQIGLGWVPHKTIWQAVAWSEADYFGPSTEPGRMQKQLTETRKFLGVKVEFSKRHGVRFAEGVVKSRE